MTPLSAALVGGLLGAVLAAAITAAIMWRRPQSATPMPVFELGDVAAIMEVLRPGTVLVGAHDELHAYNDEAEHLGVVRGTRVAIGQLLELVREARQDGEALSVTLEHAASRGRARKQLGVRVVPMAEGRVFILAEDVGRQLRAQVSSRDFLSNATHELKTPIGAISLLAEALEDAAADPERVAHFAARIRGESSRVSDLVAQIITLSKLQGHDLSETSRLVDVDEIVALALSRSRELAASRRITLASAPAEGLVVQGDPEQLVTAMSNLVQNAIAYSDAGGRVAVSARAVDDEGSPFVDIAVSDNGIGIAAEDQARIFERFYRVDYARSRETGGTGLGLPIVNEIVENHGGEVALWSKPGSGSTFTLHLPLATPTAEGEPQ